MKCGALSRTGSPAAAGSRTDPNLTLFCEGAAGTSEPPLSGVVTPPSAGPPKGAVTVVELSGPSETGDDYE